jgi:hypothetical protein
MFAGVVEKEISSPGIRINGGEVRSKETSGEMERTGGESGSGGKGVVGGRTGALEKKAGVVDARDRGPVDAPRRRIAD